MMSKYDIEIGYQNMISKYDIEYDLKYDIIIDIII